MANILTSQFEINNVQMNPYPLPIEEIFNETLIAMGNLNTDLFSGIHPGCLSIYHFVKNYFCHIISLENLSGDGQFWKSDLDGRAASINLKWSVVTNSTGATDNQVIPVCLCCRTNIMTINVRSSSFNKLKKDKKITYNI
jgi:hypothetical protein